MTGELLELAQQGNLDGFENRCLVGLEQGVLQLGQLAQSFRQLERAPDRARVATLGQMVLESLDAESDPVAALEIARVALQSDPKNDQLRQHVIDLYRKVHGQRPGFEKLLEASGLTSGRPARVAIRVLETVLTLEPGDTLHSRTEDVIVEVLDVDLETGLITLRRDGRPRTLAPLDLAREFERIDKDDFRVLRQLRPDRLRQLLSEDPLAVILGLLRAHDGMINQDELKQELVPRYIDAKAWSKWWTAARAAARKCPNVIVEGRSPVVLTYCAEGRTAADEAWDAFQATRDPNARIQIIDNYLRETRAHKETPDPALFQRCLDHLLNARAQRTSFTESLLVEKLARVLETDERHAAVKALREASDPAALVAGLEDAGLWSLALDAAEEAFGEQVGPRVARWMATAPAGVLDRIAKLAIANPEALSVVQSQIDMAVAEPIDYPELIYWLWKGPSIKRGLALPTRDELFTAMVDTLAAIDRTLHVDAAAARHFRQRAKAALSLRSFAYARECLEHVSRERAVTLRRQLDWLEGIGQTVQAKLVNMLREIFPDLWHVAAQPLELWEDENVLWGTQAGIEAKQAEVDELVNVKMRENAKRIGEAAAHGDLSENSEYKFALEERDFLRARVAQINQQLSIARPIDAQQVLTDRVSIGSRVVLRNTEDGTTREMIFLGPFDADAERGICNYKAPFAQKLLGRHVGDRATVAIDNADVEFEVVSISNALAN